MEKAFPTLEAGLADEQMKIRQRLPYVMENTWNRDKQRSFDQVQEAAEAADDLCERILEK